MSERDLQLEEAQREKEEQEAKKSNFKNFYQINTKEASRFTQLIAKEPKAAAILNFFFENMDKTNALMCSHKVLQNRFDISASTVKRAISILRDGGFIHIFKSGSSNVYVVNPNLAWKTYGKNAKYCQFPATIILDYDEQEITETRKNYKSKMNRFIVPIEDGNGLDTSTGEIIENEAEREADTDFSNLVSQPC